MDSHKYILIDKKVVEEPDLYKWGAWMEDNREFLHVGDDSSNGYRISTIFLGLNHQYGEGPPLLYETMIFKNGDWQHLYCDRYSTWEEAETGHKEVLERVKSGELPDDKRESN